MAPSSHVRAHPLVFKTIKRGFSLSFDHIKIELSSRDALLERTRSSLRLQIGGFFFVGFTGFIVSSEIERIDFFMWNVMQLSNEKSRVYFERFLSFMWGISAAA